MVTRKIESYHDLVVWQKSHEIVIELFKIKLGKKETETLGAKIRDIAASIPSNIAVGFKKRGKKPKLYFYRSALTAIQELDYYVFLLHDLGLLKRYDIFEEEIQSIERMLKQLIRANSPQQAKRGSQ